MCIMPLGVLPLCVYFTVHTLPLTQFIFTGPLLAITRHSTFWASTHTLTSQSSFFRGLHSPSFISFDVCEAWHRYQSCRLASTALRGRTLGSVLNKKLKGFTNNFDSILEGVFFNIFYSFIFPFKQ